MKNYSIHLKSSDAGNIYVNGSFVGLIDNVETFAIDLKVYCKMLIVTKEPISNQKKLLLPYTVKLAFDSSISCDSDYVTVVPYKQNEYDIILEVCDVKNHKKLEKIYDDFVENYNVIIVNDGLSYVNVYQMNVLKFSTTIPEIHTVVCEKNNNYIIIKGATQNSKFYLLVLDENNDFTPVINTSCEQLEQTPQSIKYLKKINDIAKHASVFVLDLVSGQNAQEYYVYLKENAVVTETKNLVPYAFLEALKVKNYSLAKQYLSQTLLQKTSDEHLEKYFENLNNIYYNSYNQSDSVVNYTVKTNEFKSFDFTIVNNKIDDIDEVELR